MRTQAEIVAEIRRIALNDLVEARMVLVEYCDAAHVAEFVTPELAATWTGTPAGDFAGFGPPTNRTLPLDAGDREFILQALAHYLAFAWEKALEKRGISASRSIDKLRQWLWLLGDDELCAVCDDDAMYPPYGIPILRRIAAKYELPDPTKRRTT